MNRSDTICAISTPAGIGGVALLRLSGPEAKTLAESALTTPKGHRMTLQPHKAKFAQLHHQGALLDEVVATWFEAPHSYTGEEVVEISCHGSMYIQQTMLQLFMEQGARLAEPGEFTLRAFLNGRLNLSQAEAVADLIDAQSSSAHQLAISQLRGGYAHKLEQMRQQLVDLSALMELELDFSDEDVQFANREQLKALLAALQNEVTVLIDSFQLGNALKQGIPIAILGRPNAGKSSLLNALVHEDRAIVSPIPGTTRDTLEETLTIQGINFRFIDTAGLRSSDDPIEQQGIDRATMAARRAAIVLYVATCEDKDIAQQINTLKENIDLTEKQLIVLLNKSDIATPPSVSLPDTNIVALSARTGQGLDELLDRLVTSYKTNRSQRDVILTNARHLEALHHVDEALKQVSEGLAQEMPPDLVTIDMRDALYHLGTITGQVTNDEILGTIFSRFCIGK